MDKIDLDAIIGKNSPLVIAFIQHGGKFPSLAPCDVEQHIKNMMKEAIHQAIVLASNKNPVVITSDEGFYTTVYIKKQDILDIEKLIV